MSTMNVCLSTCVLKTWTWRRSSKPQSRFAYDWKNKLRRSTRYYNRHTAWKKLSPKCDLWFRIKNYFFGISFFDRDTRYTLYLNLYLSSLNWHRDLIPHSIASSWTTEHTCFEKIPIQCAFLEYGASSHFSLDNLCIYMWCAPWKGTLCEQL